MDFSPQQDAALSAVAEWLRAGNQQVFRLFGYAGTGKTTLAKHLASDVEGQVNFAAYTGKAALVLRERGCPNASTIHSLIYRPKDRSRVRLSQLEAALAELEPKEGETAEQAKLREEKALRLRIDIQAERRNLARPAFDLNVESQIAHSKLVVIDECSMVDARMGEDLLSFGRPILVLGDPAQLPPVASGGFFTEAEPDMMLTEIHRQARDNPIIALATAVREGRELEPGSYGESRVIRKADIDRRQMADKVLLAQQIIVGRNVTRNAINRRVREIRGFTNPLPQPEDKLVCLRNNHDLGLLNGSLWDVREVWEGDERLSLNLFSLEHGFLTVEAWAKPFTDGGARALDSIPWWERKEAEEFDYGYALTCHKAQGSQWNTVIVFDESAAFRSNARRWLYTAITRASDRIEIVQD